jgi:hypothetical protein
LYFDLDVDDFDLLLFERGMDEDWRLMREVIYE